MEQKIAELTEKLYKEGVEKGEEEKNTILDSARAEADSIRSDAKKEAKGIVADAQAKAVEMKRNAESEIKLSSLQAISALKQRIVDLLMENTVDDVVSGTLSDAGVIKDLIKTFVQNWKADSQEAMALDILLPENSRASLEKSLEGSLKKLLKEEVTVQFSKKFKGGFQIGPQGASYKISLTDSDFNEFFKEYLRPKTRSFLFEE